jgi:hypothetical protein
MKFAYNVISSLFFWTISPHMTDGVEGVVILSKYNNNNATPSW